MKLKYIPFIAAATLSAHNAMALDTDASLRLKMAEIPASRAADEYLPLVLDISEDTSVADMEQMGIHVWHRRGNMVLASVPMALVTQGAETSGILKASLGPVSSPQLDRAVPDTRADIVLAGGGELPKAYSGRGVLVGMSDIGFDATHPAFAGRLVGFTNYDLQTNSRYDLLATGAVTDTDRQTHATHVCGIMAGDDPSTVYRGVARGSQIFATTSTALYDANILCGVEEIIEYAKTHDMPAVINLSLGTTIGPHDGTSAFDRYLDMCAADAAIVVSAGNHGNTTICANKAFTEDDNSLCVGMTSVTYDDLMMFKGSADVWGDTSETLRMRIRVWNIYDEKYDYSTEWFDFDTLTDGALIIDCAQDPYLKKFYKGTMSATGGIDPINGRYNIGIAFDLHSLIEFPDGGFSNVRPVIETASVPGNGVWVYAGGDLILSGRSLAGNIVSGGSERSISDMACGFSYTSVGSATTRVTAPRPGGGSYDWAGYVQLNKVSKFSSYGTLDDGRRLPQFCAPGAYIVAPANSAWVDAGYGSHLVPTDSPAPYMADCGTSMASPHAAGIMALWLEANPELTPLQLRQIAVETAVERGVSREDPRTGAGLIDALDGIRKAINFNGISSPRADLVKVYRDASRLVVEGADSTTNITVTDISGRSVNPDHLPGGVVIVRITTTDSTIVRKI